MMERWKKRELSKMMSPGDTSVPLQVGSQVIDGFCRTLESESDVRLDIHVTSDKRPKTKSMSWWRVLTLTI